MRSCALRIFEAATISIALVIFRVFCTLRIFIRISLVPGILSLSPHVSRPTSKSAVPFPVLDRRLDRLLVVRRQVLGFFHPLHVVGILPLDVLAHRLLGGERL